MTSYKFDPIKGEMVLVGKGDKGETGETGATGAAGTNGTDGASFVWEAAYVAETSYAVNDVVSYNGSSYICKFASTGNLPTNTTYWDLMAQKGADGAGAVESVNSMTGAVTLDSDDIDDTGKTHKFIPLNIDGDLEPGQDMVFADFQMKDSADTIHTLTIQTDGSILLS